MRFSLTTLVLLSLWSAAAMGVWFRREAWVLERVESPGTGNIITEHHELMPDGLRRLKTQKEVSPYIASAFPSQDLFIVDERTNRELYRFEGRNKWFSKSGGVSDDTFSVTGWSDQAKRNFYYRRRFPEWWWGHLYRPEVWVFAITTLALLYRALKAWRTRKASHAL
jgi:hypothetical protein